MSALYRAPIFFLTSLRGGWRQAVSAMIAESAFRCVTSGFYGAITQRLRYLEPPWLAILLVLVVLPLIIQALEYLFHWLRGTPNLGAGVLVSLAVTAYASLFNWYAMRKGALLTGNEGKSFVSDLLSLPRVIFGFLAAGPLALARLIRGRSGSAL